LRQALNLNAKRHKQDPKSRDLVAEAQRDPRFASIKANPEFQKLTAQR
jgi:hypothetical protein